mgnify:CR=1 FL=1
MVPVSEQKNWQSYNNFRMNAQGADVFFAPDLVAVFGGDHIYRMDPRQML